MKIRNVILALGLAIVTSFSFATTVNATTSNIPAVEDGVTGITGVIDYIAMDNNVLVVNINTSSTVQLSLMSFSGQRVWSTKTTAETITIPVSHLTNGTYTLVARFGKDIEFLPVIINKEPSRANEEAQF